MRGLCSGGEQMNETNVADLLSGIVGLITVIPNSLEDTCGDPVVACLMQLLEDLANELGVNNLVRWDARLETTKLF